MEYVEIINLQKKFGNRTLFDNVSLKINKGDIVAITGPSGSGKTTFLNIIGLLEKASMGQVVYGEYGSIVANGKKSLTMLRYEIGYLFQNYALIDNETVLYNLRVALEYKKNSKKESLEEIKKVLAIVNLDEEILSSKVYTLSGGEQQRVAMARIMLKPCSLILADEPTGNLDNENSENIFNLLKYMGSQDKIVIIVTHDVKLAEKCTKRISLNSCHKN